MTLHPKRRAALVISNEKLTRLLHLRDGIQIVCGNYDARTESFELYLRSSLEVFPVTAPGAESCGMPLLELVDM